MNNPRVALIALIVVTIAALYFIWSNAVRGGPLWLFLLICGSWILCVRTWAKFLMRVRDPEFQAGQARLRAAIAEVGEDKCILCGRPLAPWTFWQALTKSRPPFHDPGVSPECWISS